MTNVAFKVLQALTTQSITQKWAFLCSPEAVQIYIVLSIKGDSIISYLLVNAGEIISRNAGVHINLS